MEEKPCLLIPYSDGTLEVVSSVRDIPPAHFLFKIESFSLLSELLDKSKSDNYESSDFEVGGYKWKLLLYPDGNKKQDVNGYISLYLTLSETENLPHGGEVNVVFKFFVFDHIRDKYLTLEAGRVIRFHAWKTQSGFPRFFSLNTFNDPANGYLVDDCCVFGAEVFIIKSEGKGKSESLSMINEPDNGTFTWKLDNFSKLKDDSYLSDSFSVGGSQWKLLLYPNGNKKQDVNGYISLYLTLSETENLPHGNEVNVVFKFFVFDHIRDKYLTLEAGRVIRFHAWKIQKGFPRLLSLSTFNDPANGYLVDDCCVFGAEVFVIKSEGKGKSVSLSMINQPDNGTFTWKLDNFSKLKNESYLSDGFSVGGSQWKLKLYPTGVSLVKGQSLSLLLHLHDYSNFRPGWKFLVEFFLSIKDQVHGQHRERKGIKWYNSSSTDRGSRNFISLSDLNDEKNGFIVNDTLIAEGKITFISIVKCFM